MKKLTTLCKVFLAAALAFGAASCVEESAPVDIKVPAGDVTFAWNATEPQIVPVDANYDWEIKETDEHDICTATKTEDGKGVLITPNVNYASVAYTATVTIVAGNGDVTGQKDIRVSQGANAKTYITFLDSEFQGNNNPVIIMESNPDAEPIVREIRLVTNNVLSVKASSDQNVEVPKPEPEVKAALESPYDWFSYEVRTENTDEGEVTVLVLTSEFNESTSEYRTVAIEVVSGSKDIANDIVTTRIGVIVMPDTPMIYINPETTGNAPFVVPAEGITMAVTVASNVDYDDPEGDTIFSGAWDGYATFTEVKTEGRTRTYEFYCPPAYAMSERTAHFPFFYRKDDGTHLTNSFNILQEAAPAANVILENEVLVLDNATKSALVGIETSLPVFTECTVADLEGKQVSWLKAQYDSEAGVIMLTAGNPVEEAREAVVTVAVGKSDNYATATLNVTQLGTTPSIILTPAEVQISGNGDPVVVKVTTNQDSWTVDYSASSDFTLTVDEKASTITVSGTPLTSGLREAEYTVTAGSVTAKLKVTQKMSYAVGDPYMAVINGKSVPVGIVYEVDADGMHGKAFSLTVKNSVKEYFLYHEDDYGQDYVELPSNCSPTSKTNGLTNMKRMKNFSDWETRCQTTKWVHDLGQAQGVEWYIPAIDELRALLSYMSGTTFVKIPNPNGAEADVKPEIEMLDMTDPDAVQASWDKIKALYVQYTSPDGESYSDYYTEEQYVILNSYTTRIEVGADGSKEEVMDDPGDHRVFSVIDEDYNCIEFGDDLTGQIWGSSTIEYRDNNPKLYTINMRGRYYEPLLDADGNFIINKDGLFEHEDLPTYLPGLVERTMTATESWPMNDWRPGPNTSLHPICRF